MEEEDVEDEAAAARHQKLIERAVGELQQIAEKHKRPAVTECAYIPYMRAYTHQLY